MRRRHLICVVLLRAHLDRGLRAMAKRTHNLPWDASTYYMLGAALSEGKGYSLPSELGEIHAIQYSPVAISYLIIDSFGRPGTTERYAALATVQSPKEVAIRFHGA